MTASGTRTAGVAVAGTFATREVITDVETVFARVEQALADLPNTVKASE